MRATRWIWLVLAALVAASCTAPPGDPDPSGPQLRVMTYNISHGLGIDGVADLDRVATTIDSSGADVVGLQEVDRNFSERSNFVDQATYLAHALGMDVAFGANIDLDPIVAGQPRRQYGNAMLSRSPLTSIGNVALPRSPTSEQRGLLHASVTVDGVDVTVLVTHLQHDAPAERVAQVTAIGAELDAIGGNVVLLGDLNAAPGTPEVEQLLTQLTDSWATAGVGDGFTYSSSAPHTRIDYVMTTSGVVARTAAVLASSASDHLPVVADLALPSPATALVP